MCRPQKPLWVSGWTPWPLPEARMEQKHGCCVWGHLCCIQVSAGSTHTSFRIGFSQISGRKRSWIAVYAMLRKQFLKEHDPFNLFYVSWPWLESHQLGMSSLETTMTPSTFRPFKASESRRIKTLSIMHHVSRPRKTAFPGVRCSCLNCLSCQQENGLNKHHSFPGFPFKSHASKKNQMTDWVINNTKKKR